MEISVFIEFNFGKYSARKFSAMFGLSTNSVFVLWSLIKQVPSFEQDKIKPAHLFYTLFFLKNYPSLDVCSVVWKVDAKTFRFYCWRTIYFIYIHVNTVKKISSFLYD